MKSRFHGKLDNGLPSGLQLPRFKNKETVVKIPTMIPYNPDETVPDCVRGSYSNDFNINLIHKAILVIFAHRKGTIGEKIKKLNSFKHMITCPLTYNEIKIYVKEIYELEKEINDIKNCESEKKYLSQAITILEKYSTVSSDESKGVVSIWKLVEKTVEDESIVEKRLAIIGDFLDLAKKYLTIEVIETKHTKAKCPGCGNDFSNVVCDDDLGFTTCTCGNQQDTLSYAPAHRDYIKTNIGTRNTYEDRENFEKGLIKFQGKQKQIPPDKLYEQLETYFDKITTIPKRSEILSMECDKYGRKPKTSVQMMIEALIMTNNTSFYYDLNLIMHIFWGWKLPEISDELYKQLIIDYDATQIVYYSIPDKNRGASLNVQWRILVHLLARNYPVRKDGFKLQTSRDSLEFHQIVWKIMCEKTGVPFVPVI